ncbi:MAG: hypothetical protein IBX68_03935 [Dehalococcoidia bacterium]|nr:hypothetical protein [Dehalococcoidia bacterium]
MADSLEYRCGGLRCFHCKKTYYYREHRPAGESEAEILRCPGCNEELVEVPVDTFMDGSDEMLRVLDMLDSMSGEEGVG